MNNVLSHYNAKYGIIKVRKSPYAASTARGVAATGLRRCDMASISQTPSIYQIRHIDSGRVYVGSAINPRDRLTAHKYTLRKGRHHSEYLQHAWDKYGADAFVFEIIEPVLLIEDLIAREQYWIDTLRASTRKYGYNISPTAGSVLGVKLTDEARARASEQAKALWKDPILRAKRSEQAKALWKDPVYRAKRTAQSKALAAKPEVRAAASEWPDCDDKQGLAPVFAALNCGTSAQ
jgi:group I intron endonuclease